MMRRIPLIYFVVGLALLCFSILVLIVHLVNMPAQADPFMAKKTLFPIQSIDTMKDSRDRARSGANDSAYAGLIAQDISLIASSGATHVAIDTPYDAEFMPVLQAWVAAARARNLSVWFRGNFSGWEGWFGYPKLSRSDHIAMTKQFILNNPGLFKDGDIFTACPECENGGPGDPRRTGDADGHRQFLIDEYGATRDAFGSIGKKVDSAPTSMNLDVAKLVMDKATARALGGVVAIDNYTKTPEQFAADIAAIHESSGARIIIGEFGFPIPDLNGGQNDGDQAAFIEKLLAGMYAHADIIDGANYWVVRNGSTALLSDDGTRKPAAGAIAHYYQAPYALGMILNDLHKPIGGYSFEATVQVAQGTSSYAFTTDGAGRYQLFLPYPGKNVIVHDPAGLYPDLSYTPEAGTGPASANDLILVPKRESVWNKFLKFLGAAN